MRKLSGLPKSSVQPPYDYNGALRGLLELFVSAHNNTVEEKKRFVVGNVTVMDNNDYVSYCSTDFTITLDAIRDKHLGIHFNPLAPCGARGFLKIVSHSFPEDRKI